MLIRDLIVDEKLDVLALTETFQLTDSVIGELLPPGYDIAYNLRNDGRRTWWRHQMKTFSALLAFCAENSPVPVNSPHKGQWRGALMFSLICTWINSWVNNPEAGDLRRHRAHCDVSVMRSSSCYIQPGTKVLHCQNLQLTSSWNNYSATHHYCDIIMGAIAFQITSLTIVYSTVYSGADQRKHQSSASLASVWGIHRWPVNSPHKWPVTRKMFPFDGVIMI